MSKIEEFKAAKKEQDLIQQLANSGEISFHLNRKDGSRYLWLSYFSTSNTTIATENMHDYFRKALKIHEQQIRNTMLELATVEANNRRRAAREEAQEVLKDTSKDKR